MSCKEYMKKIGIDAWEYWKQMKQENTESIKWTNENEGVMTLVQFHDLKDEAGKLIGTKKEEIHASVTVDDIQTGIDGTKKQLLKCEDDLNNNQNQLKSLGKIPKMTAGMIRLRNDLEMMSKIDQAKKIAMKIVPLEAEIEKHKAFINKRENLLSQRFK